MRHREQRLADLVIVGHVGFATDRTVNGSVSYVGGSGFVVAFAGSALLDGVGLVAQVGEDFDLDVLRRLPIDTERIAVQPGASARLRIDQASDGTISLRSHLGGAGDPS